MATEIGEAAQTAVAALQEQSTRDSISLAAENAHKRAFLQTFRRWEGLFKRADRGDVRAEKWLIADYYASLCHLSPMGFDALTDLLKERCTFCPTVRECLEAMKADPYDWGHPFRTRRECLFQPYQRQAIANESRLQIEQKD